jgi:large subunit ribosomal protein L15e
MRDVWNSPKENELWKQRLLEWRDQPATVRLEKPTRIDKARSVGYKAKQGIVVVRQRVLRSSHTRRQIRKGRRPKHFGRRMNLRKNFQQIAEERVQKKFTNLVVLNSYWVAEDGKNYWFEVVLVDPSHPVIKADQSLNWVCEKKNLSRAFHGHTSAGRESQGKR